jgi:heat shock protein HtpX
MATSRRRLQDLASSVLPARRGAAIRADGPQHFGRLDGRRADEHAAINRAHTLVMIGAVFVVLLVSAFLLLSWWGLLAALAGVGSLYFFGPRMSPQSVMRLYRAVEIGEGQGRELRLAVAEVARRAGLVSVPRLYLIPSATLNAFSTGTTEHSAIALTEGLMRKLDLSEIIAVLAHEIAHVANDDLWVMSLADGMTRLTRTLSWLAILLTVFNLPSLLTGLPGMSWIAIGLLYLAPAVSSLAQLSLSRAREYDADLDAALLTGSPQALAAALTKLEAYQGNLWEDILYPMRRVPHPSVLRSHPMTVDRVARLRALDPASPWPPIRIVSTPMISSLAGYGADALRPRYRWSAGVWY